jgi:predicted ribonuclease YlaK
MNLMLHGVAGTGKTFISLYLALEEILKKNSTYNQVVIVRSVVPSRDMGFLPGSVKEKSKIYEEPYKAICDDLFGRGDGYDLLRHENIVQFTTTSHLRGSTFNNSIIIADEFQNMTFQELDTLITRTGDNSRLIFCGDIRQTDLQRDHEKSGILTFTEIVGTIDSFASIEFTIDDIVRSELVKQYIIAKLKRNIV